MLQRIHGRPSRACLLLRDAAFPAPFPHELEYSPACRGTWNIVHTGMTLPESHQIFACASGCLRGVVLTAAEMGLMDQFSSIELKERDLVQTDNEQLLIEGITDILHKLPKLPRAVLLFPACVHHFLGCDLRYVYKTLRERFPGIDFAECFMDPIRQTKSLTPEERLRRAIFRLLPSQAKTPRTANIIGSNLKTDPQSDFARLLQQSGWLLRDMTRYASYDDFLRMGGSCLNLYTNPFSLPAVRDLKKRLGQDFLYLPQVWRAADIKSALYDLLERLDLTEAQRATAEREIQLSQQQAERALQAAKSVVGARPIALDLTFTFRPLNLARLLVEHGFRVTRLYSDAFLPEEEADFRWLQQQAGDIELFATKNPDMRILPREAEKDTLALGQKAAYFCNTPYFVNYVEGGGSWGFAAVTELARMMAEACHHPQDIRAAVSPKAWGGPSIL